MPKCLSHATSVSLPSSTTALILLHNTDVFDSQTVPFLSAIAASA